MIVEFEGQRFEFPDDATDQEIAAAIGGASAPQAPAEPGYVGPQIPGRDVAVAPDGSILGPMRNGVPVEPNPVGQSAPGRALQVGTQGVGAGLADVAGMPVDLTSSALNLGLSGYDLLSSFLGGEGTDFRFENPIMGSQWLKDVTATAAEGAGMDVLTPDEMSPWERRMSRMNELGTAAVVTGGGLGAAPRSGNSIIAGIQKPYAQSATPLIGDAAAGAGAGAAENLYEEYTPEWIQDSPAGPILEALAATGGGVGGATAGTIAGSVGSLGAKGLMAAGRGLRPTPPKNQILDEITGQPFKRSDVDTAAQYVQGVASNPAAAAAEIGEKAATLGRAGPRESLPTTGLLSDDVGLAMFENAARQKRQVPFIERDQRVRTQARDIVDQSAPRGADARDFTDTAARAAKAQETPALRELERAAGRQEEIKTARRRDGSVVEQFRGQKPEAAEAIDRAVVDETLRPMQEQSSRLYSEVDPGRAAMAGADDLLDAATRVRQSLGDLNAPEKVIPGGLLSRIEGLTPPDATPPQVAIGDIVDAIPEIATTMERARRAGNYQLADNLRALRGSMEALIQREADAGSEAAQRALAAKQNYTETVGAAFGGGPGNEARRFRQDFNLDRAGRSTTPPSQTARRFLQPGKPERAAALRNILDRSPNPEAGRAAVREYLLSDLAESGALDRKAGALRPDSLRSWRDKWGSALDLEPGLRSEVDTWIARAQRGERLSGEAAAAVKAADAKLTDAQRAKGALALVLDKDPVNAVNAVFSSGDPERAMKEIVSKIGRGGNRTQAIDGLKAAVRDWLVERKTMGAVQNTTTGQNPVSFDQLDKLFKQHERTLAQVYKPEEMNSLRQAHAFLAPLKDKELGATTGSQTASRLADKFWRTAEIGLKAKYGILKGGGILRTLRLWADTLPSNDEAVQQLIQQMWFDPDLAQHLLTRPTKDVGTPQWNARLNVLLGGAVGARESVAPDE